jgi:hypothetical protein
MTEAVVSRLATRPLSAASGTARCECLACWRWHGAETTVRTFVEGGFVEVGKNDGHHHHPAAQLTPVLSKPPRLQAELKRLAAEQATGDEAIEARMKAESAARERLRAARG